MNAEKFDSDLEYFAGERLYIKTKQAGLRLLKFNRAQRHLDEQLEKQLAETGRVRAIVLKGRQLGISTYIAARFYHKTSRRQAVRTYILTHEDRATTHLFGIVNLFHEKMPDAERPSTSASNAIELVFDMLDSGYVVGTAGTKGTGRSQTIHNFHGSEIGFWRHADEHAAGIIQAVPNAPGTEVILESTAKGMGNFFHRAWRDAETGKSPYIAIFIPWFWDDEYRMGVPEGFALDLGEQEYADAYGLDLEQMAWRRAKLSEMDEIRFQEEYPANASEAFQSGTGNSFIKARDVLRARKATRDESGPLVIGFDPSGGSGADGGDASDEVKGDRASMAWRRGRKLRKVISKRGMNTMEMAAWCADTFKREKPARMFVDVGGAGRGVYDRLRELVDDPDKIRLVNFGSKPVYPPPTDKDGKPYGGPFNRRAEMWMRSRDWLTEEGGVDIPDSDSLQADACAPGFKTTSLQQIVLERKEEIRARGLPSPDEWDAVALTFAEDVSDVTTGFGREIKYPKRSIY